MVYGARRTIQLPRSLNVSLRRSPALSSRVQTKCAAANSEAWLTLASGGRAKKQPPSRIQALNTPSRLYKQQSRRPMSENRRPCLSRTRRQLHGWFWRPRLRRDARRHGQLLVASIASAAHTTLARPADGEEYIRFTMARSFHDTTSRALITSTFPAPLPNLRHRCRRRQLLAVGANTMGLAPGMVCV
jgi:hypothetical protein